MLICNYEQFLRHCSTVPFCKKIQILALRAFAFALDFFNKLLSSAEKDLRGHATILRSIQIGLAFQASSQIHIHIIFNF